MKITLLSLPLFFCSKYYNCSHQILWSKWDRHKKMWFRIWTYSNSSFPHFLLERSTPSHLENRLHACSQKVTFNSGLNHFYHFSATLLHRSSTRKFWLNTQWLTAALLIFVSHKCNMSIELHSESQIAALDIFKAFNILWPADFLNKLPSNFIFSKLCTSFNWFLSNRRIYGLTILFNSINPGISQRPFLYKSNYVSCYAYKGTCHCNFQFPNHESYSVQHL